MVNSRRLARTGHAAACLLVASLCAGCGDRSAEVDGERDGVGTAPTSLPAVDLSDRPVADDPDPSARAGAVAGFIDCEHGVWQGGWAPDYGPLGSGASPAEAIEQMGSADWLGMPDVGFVAAGRDDARFLYVHEVDDSPKAALVIADTRVVDLDTSDRWAIETFARCDPAEFDPSDDDRMWLEVWVDEAGTRVPTSVIMSAPGPAHCDWELVTFLTLNGQGYVSDPRRLLVAEGLAPFDPNARLPSDATDTGYRRDDRELWLSADRSVAYVVQPDSVEAWPATPRPIACG